MTNGERTSAPAKADLKPTERVDAWIRLYTQELERQKQIESIQWRINFSVWTFIILATHALNKAQIKHHWWFLFGGILLALLHFVAILKNIRSVRATAQMWRHYRKSADALLYDPEQMPIIKTDVWPWFDSPQWWVVAIFGTTLMLLAVALVLLW